MRAATDIDNQGHPQLNREKAAHTLNIRFATMSYGDVFLAEVLNATQSKMRDEGYSAKDIEFMRNAPRTLHLIGTAPPQAKEGTRHVTFLHDSEPFTAINGIDPQKSNASWMWMNTLGNWLPGQDKPHPIYHAADVVCGRGEESWPEYIPQYTVATATMATKATDHCAGHALFSKELAAAAIYQTRMAALREGGKHLSAGMIID